MERNGSRGKEKPCRAGTGFWKKAVAAPELKTVGDRARGEGNGQIRKRIYASKVPQDSKSGKGYSLEENSLSCVSRQSSSKQASGTPIRRLIDEEMSKELEPRWHSPNVVARLMGLDALPPELVCKTDEEVASCSPQTSLFGCRDNYLCCEGNLFQSMDENQDFKDVFEVDQVSKPDKQKGSLHRQISSSKKSEIDMALIREKFMDAKRLSTDETLQKSKEFDDALEVLDSNKNLFLKFLQEPNSLFTKHLQDLKCALSPADATYITILKSSRGTKHGNNETYHRSERNSKRCAHIRKEDVAYTKQDVAYTREPVNRLVSSSFKEDRSSHDHNLSKSDYMVKTNACICPTQIVVLKPSLDNAQNSAKTVFRPRSTEHYQFHQRHKETRRSSIQELHAEGRAQKRSSLTVDMVSNRTKNSREFARDVTEQMRCTVNNNHRKASSLQFNRKKSTDCSRTLAGTADSEKFQWTSNHFNYLDDCSSLSTSFSAETSVSREARKRLSERWKMTKWSQEAVCADKVSGTLGEMLSLSDKEMPSTLSNRFISLKEKILAKDEVVAGWGFPSGISSNDGWKDGCSRNLQRSNSLPTSSVNLCSKQRARCKAGGNRDYMLKDALDLEADIPVVSSCSQIGCSSRQCFKCPKNNGPEYDPDDDENMQPEREIHVNHEESRSNIDVNLPSDNNVIYESSESSISGRSELVDDFLVPETRFSSLPGEESISANKSNGEFSDYNNNDITIEGLTSELQVEPVSSLDPPTESESSSCPKETERPSPVSVLEPPEEENSSIGCFEKVSADLKELRMQLRLLKLESSDTSADESEMFLSDNDAGGCHSNTERGERLQLFRDESERDFSYLLDVLIDSGVHSADRDRLLDTFCMVEYPVQLNVFDNLEKKYKIQESWSRSERKQLFDLINSILVDISVPCRNLHPFVKRSRVFEMMWTSDSLVEKIWHMVVANQRGLAVNLEKVLEPTWFDLEGNVNEIGKEIERMLKEDLLEEIVHEIVLG